ncbi:hypothetical protein NGR_c11270 [Sinorhizobium fredii NGR234]|uniref:Uncharacterized protein n=1 Tax=Sinorhizobium fredii (strain NBRC 101917 / NGR234) TaxID=394 RepID=C3MAD3_SINFN|nr:hypothetical protein [Sinorhizobium fredii]ACP24912.1 hypothetical protein NGR_c11270 [Sinorhizobium fredii NGR234]
MTALVQMQPGDWALAFDQPYFLPEFEMAAHLERFARRGGGWDSHQASDIFVLHQISEVKPKTYFAVGDQRRHPRNYVFATGQSEKAMLALRDKFFAIGVEADGSIEKEMYRLVEPFARQKRAEALAKVHATLPHIFGRRTS